MKKVLLSLLVVVGFVGYSLHEKKEAADVPPVIAPATPTPTPTPSLSSSTPMDGSTGETSSPTPQPQQSNGQYRDGEYTGSVADAFYGNIQVKAIISGGKISDVQFLQYPNDRPTSIEINQQAMPFLKQEAIQAQSAKVDVVSGATDSSRAFVESLSDALSQAKS